jgi:co-chaperonin GroES (HSP10)
MTTSPEGIILPPSWVPPEIKTRDEPDPQADNEAKQLVIPRPTGWKLLCAVPTFSKTFEGTNIVKADSVLQAEEQTTSVLWVMAVGPDAYRDPEKFPSGPWCKEGDFVLVRTYAGTRFRVFGKEFRLLNDDQIDAVVDDPRGISRA